MSVAEPIHEVAGQGLFGSAAEIKAAPHRFPAEIALANGGLARFRVGPKRLVACASVEAVRHVLVHRHENYPRSYHRRNAALVIGNGLIFNEGDEWLRQRRMLLPGFRSDRVPAWYGLVASHARETAERWSVAREPVDACDAAMRLSMRIIGDALFSRTLTEDEVREFRTSVGDCLRAVRARNVSPLPLPPWVPTPANRRLHEVRGALDAFADREIEARRALPADAQPADLLSAMLEARDPDTGEAMSADYLRDEFKTLVIAGFETTANALAWTLYLLGKHPDVAAQVREEADRVLGEREPDAETVAALTFTMATIHESMRLFPPVYTVARHAVEDDVVSGRKVNRGDVMLVSIYGAHRDPAEWTDAEAFRPERFLDRGGYNPDAYLPFGVGKHRCLGATFAAIELAITVAEWARRFEWSLPDGFEVGESAFITLTPDRPIPLRLRPR